MVLLISVRTELAAFRLPYSDKLPVLNKTNVQISELPIDQVDDVESAPDCSSDVHFAHDIARKNLSTLFSSIRRHILQSQLSLTATCRSCVMSYA